MQLDPKFSCVSVEFGRINIPSTTLPKLSSLDFAYISIRIDSSTKYQIEFATKVIQCMLNVLFAYRIPDTIFPKIQPSVTPNIHNPRFCGLMRYLVCPYRQCYARSIGLFGRPRIARIWQFIASLAVGTGKCRSH